MSTAIASMLWMRMMVADLLTRRLMPRADAGLHGSRTRHRREPTFASIMQAAARSPPRVSPVPAHAKGAPTTMTLADRVAIVTGAGHGIGSATALALARAGAHVAVVDIDKAAAEKTAADVTALGRRSLALGTDVRDLASIDKLARQRSDAFGRLDTLAIH